MAIKDHKQNFCRTALNAIRPEHSPRHLPGTSPAPPASFFSPPPTRQTQTLPSLPALATYTPLALTASARTGSSWTRNPCSFLRPPELLLPLLTPPNHDAIPEADNMSRAAASADSPRRPVPHGPRSPVSRFRTRRGSRGRSQGRWGLPRAEGACRTSGRRQGGGEEDIRFCWLRSRQQTNRRPQRRRGPHVAKTRAGSLP